MFKTIKKLIAKYFSTFTYFYRYLRYKVFFLLAISIFVGVLDGFGLAMFLPLLQMVSGEESATSEGMGNLGFLVEGMEEMGVPLTLGVILLVMIIFFFLKGLTTYISNLYLVIIQQEFVRKIRIDVIDGLNRLKFKNFITADAGRIQNTMTGEVEKVMQGFASYFLALQQGILVAVYVSFAFFVDAQFALLVTVGGILTNLLYKLIYKKTKEASRKLTNDSNIYQGEIIQHVANFKYLRATGLVEFFGKRLKDTIYKIEHSRRKIGILSAIVRAAREPILILIVSIVIFIQVNLLSGDLGGILVSLLFFYRALAAMSSLQTAWNYFLSATGSFENIMDFQESLRGNRESYSKGEFAVMVNQLEIKGGNFHYGETSILRDIDLKIKKNETVAFVGESGSGKTTLVNLLTGIMPLDKGYYLIDGKNINDINIPYFQNRIGYITQEPVIFNDTIFNNVTLWAQKNESNLARYQDAINKAAILGFIETLPNKGDTELGNNGINLSGGQKQRISIARELYKDIDILIMDEATSALDSETERSIQENIDSLKGQYTILIVAHRLSTIRNTDRVVLMDNGRIEKIGAYQSLIEESDKFKKMTKLQEI